ncbi:hypothetical protein [Methylacidimicrobium sp. AP8]|uniref:hypothetical protein n=1 Tax=Methylacidimicrobium sp. AP8 TaxID=2730359 RepID=UPI0019207D4E|nr:hypothetical protein [Methylacidimicrobium sp. AP8]
MKGIAVIAAGLAFLSGASALSAADSAPEGSAPGNPPKSWQEKLADLVKRDSDLNRKIDQIDQAIRQKHDDLARSLAKELHNERSAFHRELQEVKDSVQSGIRDAARSLGKGAGQLKEEAAKLQDALEQASRSGQAAPAGP